jgi:hypothetical protein
MSRILIFIILTFLLNACTNQNDEYMLSKAAPYNNNIEFYKETVRILNKINKNMLSNMEYTDVEMQNIIKYFIVSNDKTDEERAIKTKIAFLQGDSHRYFEAIRMNDVKSKEDLLIRYQDELKELEILLDISGNE